LTNITKDIIRL